MMIKTWIGGAMRRSALARRLCILAACGLMAACDGLIDVDATASVPARYSSVLVTVTDVWFSESATAVSSDATWRKYTLDDPLTLDLVDLTSGRLAAIASDLNAPAGTYRQVRVILASAHDSLADSAEALDADWNNQVSWFDEDEEEQTAPLEVLNAEQGIGITIALEVVEVVASSSTSTLQLVFDATRDLTEFSYSGETGFLLNPSLQAYDADDVGAIVGAFNLSLLDIDTPSGRPDIQVTAQRLDESLDRRLVVASTAVSRVGAFVLSPLPIDEDEESTDYDLVVHGPGIQTLIIRDVPATRAALASATPLAIGIVQLNPADGFDADVDADAPVGQRGARIGFYQALPDDDVPYLVATAPVDPLTGRFAQPLALTRAASIAYGTYASNFTLRTATPGEGASRYRVAALFPPFGSGAYGTTLLRPASGPSDTATFTVPAAPLPTGAVTGTANLTLSITSPGKYDRGTLFVTHEGVPVGVAPLDTMLQQSAGSATLDVSGLPAGNATGAFANGFYHLEAWTWKASDPQDSFARHVSAEAVDLRSAATAPGAVTVN